VSSAMSMKEPSNIYVGFDSGTGRRSYVASVEEFDS
jgi:hypothetical protein